MLSQQRREFSRPMVRLDGKTMQVEFSSHFKERALERGIPFQSVLDAIERGWVISVDHRPSKAFQLATGLGLADRFGPFPRLAPVVRSGDTNEGVGILVSYSMRGSKFPLHVDLRVHEGVLVLTTAYWTDDAKWHPSGLATNASWARHGDHIKREVAEWSSRRAAAAA